MGFGTEEETLEFVDGMDQLDQGLRSMVAMLNRRNRAVVLIGVGKDGEVLPSEISESDVEAVRERMERGMNHLPQARVTLESDGGRPFIRIDARGYETPYSYGGWFYIRKRRPVRVDGKDALEWTEGPTCSMKRHRSFLPVLPFIRPPEPSDR